MTIPHPYLVSFLFIPSLYPPLFNSKNFSFSSKYIYIYYIEKNHVQSTTRFARFARQLYRKIMCIVRLCRLTLLTNNVHALKVHNYNGSNLVSRQLHQNQWTKLWTHDLPNYHSISCVFIRHTLTQEISAYNYSAHQSSSSSLYIFMVLS